MTVAELEELLARLPGDMPVLVGATGPFHIGLVDKQSRGVRPKRVGETRCDHGRCREWTYEEVEHGPYLVLYPRSGWSKGAPGLLDDAPEVELRGRWPRERTSEERQTGRR